MLLPSKDRGTVFFFDELETGVDQARVIKSFDGSMDKSYSPEQAIGRVKRFVFIECILISSLPYIVVASQVFYTQPTLGHPGLKILGLWKYPPAGLSRNEAQPLRHLSRWLLYRKTAWPLGWSLGGGFDCCFSSG